jgi:hypothetical protein
VEVFILPPSSLGATSMVRHIGGFHLNIQRHQKNSPDIAPRILTFGLPRLMADRLPFFGGRETFGILDGVFDEEY